MRDDPIFVFAQPRSGSTLIMRLLNACPGVVVYGEHLGQLDGIASSWINFKTHPEFGRFCSSQSPTSVFDLAHCRLKDPNYFSAVTNGLSESGVMAAYSNLVAFFGNPFSREGIRWGFKEVRYSNRGDSNVQKLVAELFPKGKSILLVRHPEDQIKSKEATKWWSDSLTDSISIWNKQASAFETLAADPTRFKLLKYESVQDAVPTEIFPWLGLDYKDQHAAVLRIRQTQGGGTLSPVLPLTRAKQAEVWSGIDWLLANRLGYFQKPEVPDGNPIG